ncbi:hypothetical protein [Nostoc sp. DSM 114159]
MSPKSVISAKPILDFEFWISELFQRYLNDIPIGGFFCGGEIGPVGGRTFLHAYTSAFGICRQNQ